LSRFIKVEGRNGEHREVEVLSKSELDWTGGVLTVRGDGRRIRATGEQWSGGQVWGDALIEKVQVQAGKERTSYAVVRFT
jgi:hypothetical protein